MFNQKFINQPSVFHSDSANSISLSFQTLQNNCGPTFIIRFIYRSFSPRTRGNFNSRTIIKEHFISLERVQGSDVDRRKLNRLGLRLINQGNPYEIVQETIKLPDACCSRVEVSSRSLSKLRFVGARTRTSCN